MKDWNQLCSLVQSQQVSTRLLFSAVHLNLFCCQSTLSYITGGAHWYNNTVQNWILSQIRVLSWPISTVQCYEGCCFLLLLLFDLRFNVSQICHLQHMKVMKGLLLESQLSLDCGVCGSQQLTVNTSASSVGRCLVHFREVRVFVCYSAVLVPHQPW